MCQMCYLIVTAEFPLRPMYKVTSLPEYVSDILNWRYLKYESLLYNIWWKAKQIPIAQHTLRNKNKLVVSQQCVKFFHKKGGGT